jgi:hypothetical protein
LVGPPFGVNKEVVKKVSGFRQKGNWSVYTMVTELNVSHTSLQNIVKTDLKLRPYKKKYLQNVSRSMV